MDDNSSASTGMKNQVKRLLEVIHQFRHLAPDMPLSAGDAPLLATSGVPAAAALEAEGQPAQMAISAR